MIVVAAVDGSEHSGEVLKTAEQFAGDGQIHAVYVSPPTMYPTMVPDMMPVATMVDMEALRKSETEAVWAAIGELPDNAVAETLHGSPASTIVDYAKNIDADLIVIGSRGRGALGSLVLGSVSHGVVHAADRNVLIVR